MSFKKLEFNTREPKSRYLIFAVYSYSPFVQPDPKILEYSAVRRQPSYVARTWTSRVRFAIASAALGGSIEQPGTGCVLLTNHRIHGRHDSFFAMASFRVTNFVQFSILSE